MIDGWLARGAEVDGGALMGQQDVVGFGEPGGRDRFGEVAEDRHQFGYYIFI